MSEDAPIDVTKCEHCGSGKTLATLWLDSKPRDIWVCLSAECLKPLPNDVAAENRPQIVTETFERGAEQWTDEWTSPPPITHEVKANELVVELPPMKP